MRTFTNTLRQTIVLLLSTVAFASTTTTLCSDGVTRGYQNSSLLRNDLLLMLPDANATEFILCPNTILDVSIEPLTISRSVILRCGGGDSTMFEDEEEESNNTTSNNNSTISRSNNKNNTNSCILQGGEHQIVIMGEDNNDTDAVSIEFHGLTFQNSTYLSVVVLVADETTATNVTFIDCLWRYHTGQSVVLIGEANETGHNLTTVVVSAGGDDDNTTVVVVVGDNTTSMLGDDDNTTLLGDNTTMGDNTTTTLGDDDNSTTTTTVGDDDDNSTSTGGDVNVTITIDDLLNMTSGNNDTSTAGTVLANSTNPNFDDTPDMPSDPLPNSTGRGDDVVAAGVSSTILENSTDQNWDDTPETPVDPLRDATDVPTNGGRSRRHDGHRLLRGGNATFVLFSNCEFVHNTPNESVVTHHEGMLTISESRFSSNNSTFMYPLLSSDGDGELSIVDTVFLDNGAPTHVFVGDDAVLQTNSGNCGSEALGNCSGVYEQKLETVITGDTVSDEANCTFTECTGECTVFETCSTTTQLNTTTESDETNSTAPSLAPTASYSPSSPIELSSVECPSNSSLVGYIDLPAIQADIGNGILDFQLCPGANMTGALALRIDQVMMTMECMDDSCLWIADKYHLRLEGEGFGFRASGITFRDATQMSISFQFDASEPNYRFDDCTWEDNAGSAVIVLDPGVALGSSGRSLLAGYVRGAENRRRLQTGGGRNDLNRCIFQNNVVAEVIYVKDSIVSMTNCTFRKNIATGSMVTAFSSSLTIKKTTFRDNFYSAMQGLVLLGDNSVLDDEQLCAVSNTPVDDGGTVCLGISTGGGDCRDLEECGTNCFSSWSNLIQAAEDATTSLMLCPYSSIEIPDGSPLKLETNGTILQCGDEGLRTDNCILSGGSDQIILSASDIQIIGVTFIGSSRTALRAEAGLNTTALVRDCEFNFHTGVAAVVSHGGGESFVSELEGSDVRLSDIINPQGEATSIELVNCLITKNTVALAPILVVGGSLTVSNSVFSENEAQVGTIGALFKTEVTAFTSCFLGNSGISSSSSVASTIFLDESSDLIRSETNFGIGNKAKGDNCANGVNLETNACIPFTSRFCESTIYDGRKEAFKRFSSCVSDIDTLVMMVSDPNTTEIEICPLSAFGQGNTTVNASLPLIVDRGNISISCGADGSRLNDCRFVGGETQLKIMGNLTNAFFRGLTFLGATQTAVMIEGASPLSAEFVDCVWEESTGESALLLKSLDPATESPTAAPTVEENTDDVLQDGGIGGRRLNQVGFEVSLARCSFEQNDVANNLVFNKGGALSSSSCTFSSNTAGQSIIATESGRLFLESSCFDGNDYDSSIGLVTSDESMSIQSDSNYVAGGASNAEGFNSTFCKAPLDSVDCFDSWEGLSAAVGVGGSLGRGSVFKLCQDSVLDADGFNTIELGVPEIVIQCGDDGALEDRCTIIGGQVQFRVSANGVTFRGINMLNSTIAAVHTVGNASEVAYFDKCLLSGHTGLAAIIGYNGDIRSRSSSQRRRTQAGIFPETDATMAVDVKDSFFLENDVELAPLSVLGGKVALESTTFTDNSGFSTGVGVWYGGELELSPSCFDDKGASPSVFVDTASSVAGVDATTAGDSSQGATCAGILSGSDCLPILDQNCNSSDIAPLTPRECYRSWIDLGNAIMATSTQDRQAISFTICANTTLDVDQDINQMVTPIVVSGVEVEIKCGEDGAREENCVISGGRSHFKLEGAGATNFIGITFESATFASIMATGDPNSIATFIQCTWRQNEGHTVLLLNRQMDVDTDMFESDILELAATSSAAMTVLADKCSFENNDVTFGVITNIGGDLNLLESIMINNRESRFGVLAGIKGATIGLSFTCFTGNTAIERGIVYIDNNSTLAFNRNAFGADNRVGGDDCTSIFMETEGSCANLGICEGNCTVYESRTCRVTSFEIDSTLEPTGAPTSFPSSLPPTVTAPVVVVGDEASSDSGGSKVGLLLTTILLPLLLIGLGAGAFIFYTRSKSKKEAAAAAAANNDDDGNGYKDEEKDGFDGDVPATVIGEESQTHSRTQELDDDDSNFEDVDINDPLTPLNPASDDLPYSDKAEMLPLNDAEQFEDEGGPPIDSTLPLTDASNGSNRNDAPLLGSMLRGKSNSSSVSKLSDDDPPMQHQTDFIRVPPRMGKRQLSNDILSFQDIPTTF